MCDRHYWHLRLARSFDAARTRKQYRLIQKEKKRLEEAGIDLELVELLAGIYQNAEQRFWSRHNESFCKNSLILVNRRLMYLT